MPFMLEKFNCKIVFCDQNVGEFQHEILGETTLPEPIFDNIKPPFPVYVDNPKSFPFQINFKNENLLHARKIFENRLISSHVHKSKIREIFKKNNKIFNEIDEIDFTVELVIF